MNDPTEHDAERFLTALQDKVQELLVLSKVPAANPDKLSFVDYSKFREKTEECLSFLVIIEGRINEVKGERKELLSEQFDKLVTATWSVLMEGSISFLSVLSEREYLPVGTRHVFEQELKTLSEAEEVMKENKNEKFLSTTMVEKRAKAREILNVVIDKAPQLLNVEEGLEIKEESQPEENQVVDPHTEMTSNVGKDADVEIYQNATPETDPVLSSETDDAKESENLPDAEYAQEENDKTSSATGYDQDVISESSVSSDAEADSEMPSESNSAKKNPILESDGNSDVKTTPATEN